MKLKSNEYQIECTPDGEYYAFLTDYHQCCTYGETAEVQTTTNAALTVKLPKKHWKPCQISPMSFSAK